MIARVELGRRCVQRRRAARLAQLAPEGAEGSRRAARLRERPARRYRVPRDDRTGVHVCLRAHPILGACVALARLELALLLCSRSNLFAQCSNRSGEVNSIL